MTNNAGSRVLLLLLVLAGCAPTKMWTSSPVIQTSSNPYYEAQIEPLTRDHNFFVSFRLVVTNRTDIDLEIDWNKTRYFHNNRIGGAFVFKGIDPKTVKELTIPPDIITPGQTFSKEIMPVKLIAWSPLRESRPAGERGFSPGMLPAGENGLMLVVMQDGKPTVEKITVDIEVQEDR
jgi:hypothetical protein